MVVRPRILRESFPCHRMKNRASKNDPKWRVVLRDNIHIMSHWEAHSNATKWTNVFFYSLEVNRGLFLWNLWIIWDPNISFKMKSISYGIKLTQTRKGVVLPSRFVPYRQVSAMKGWRFLPQHHFLGAKVLRCRKSARALCVDRW